MSDTAENDQSHSSAIPDGTPVPPQRLLARLALTFRATWDLGIVSFGGPPVHYQIFYRRFVKTSDERMRWADEKMYHDLFALSQALPGPASTKFIFCLTLAHLGFLPALLQFFLWSFPGALGMYLCALALERIPDELPEIVYAFMSGLNAGTVGVVASSAVLLSEGVLRVRAQEQEQDSGRNEDDVGLGLLRIVLILAACVSIGYQGKDIWFFPAVMAGGALIALFYGLWMDWIKQRQGQVGRNGNAILIDVDQEEDGSPTTLASSEPVWRQSTSSTDSLHAKRGWRQNVTGARFVGTSLIVAFFLVFAAINIVRIVVVRPPVLYKLFSNLFLAGTIIFGGGPVVVPLLVQYIVDEGWVSMRDFLLGLAVIQAFPGPNFNFSVLLAALTPTHVPALVASLIGFLAMFLPGLVLAAGASLIWFADRGSNPPDLPGDGSTAKASPTVQGNLHVQRIVKGVNAAAVGLVWSAVVRLWEKGYLRSDDDSFTSGRFLEQTSIFTLQPTWTMVSVSPARGTSLGDNPWWIVVAVIAFSGNRWYGVAPPLAIGLGGVLGLVWGYVAYGST